MVLVVMGGGRTERVWGKRERKDGKSDGIGDGKERGQRRGKW